MTISHSNPFPPSRPFTWLQVDAQGARPNLGQVIVEQPVSLSVNGATWLTLMCTPVDLEALALGFLFNEGVIQRYDETASVRVCDAGDNIDVWLNKTVAQPPDWRRTSGCTGGATSVHSQEDSPASAPLAIPAEEVGRYSTQQITDLVDSLFESQSLYRLAGGIHTSVLSDGQRVLFSADDIGRHNTLDKLAGRLLMQPPPQPAQVVLTTGRISSEMLQKAHRIGAHLLISRTAPSTLSLNLAQQYGITLIGYAAKQRFIVYTIPERIDFK